MKAEIEPMQQPVRKVVGRPPTVSQRLVHLEDLSAVEIGEIAGLSAGAVRTKIHRLKAALAKRFKEGGGHAE